MSLSLIYFLGFLVRKTPTSYIYMPSSFATSNTSEMFLTANYVATDLPEVVHVTPDSFYELTTTRTWDYLGLSAATPKNLLNDSNMGEEVIIGVVDTGWSVNLFVHTCPVAS